MSRSLIVGGGVLSLALALCVPLVAQDRPGMDKTGGTENTGTKSAMRHEEITIDKPYAEVASKAPMAIEHAGLILLADVDWNRFKGRGVGTMPGGHKLEGVGAVSNIRSFFLCDNEHVNKVLEEPQKALWAPAIAVCEKAGKTTLLYFRPTVKLEEMKKHGIIPAEKYEEHLKCARDFEKKLDEVIENLRGSRSS